MIIGVHLFQSNKWKNYRIFLNNTIGYTLYAYTSCVVVLRAKIQQKEDQTSASFSLVPDLICTYTSFDSLYMLLLGKTWYILDQSFSNFTIHNHHLKE